MTVDASDRASRAPEIHPSALVDPRARIGAGTRIWAFTQIREGAAIGRECNIGMSVYIGIDVVVGDHCKVHNRASLFEGVTLENGVFVGPHAVFTNDRRPRATNPDGSLQTEDDWDMGRSFVRRGASIGAGAIVLPGHDIGWYAMVGAGAVVTSDVPPHGVLIGNPARLAGYVCLCGRKKFEVFLPDADGVLRCPRCSL